MKGRSGACLAVVLLGGATGILAADNVIVMTQNQYLGADLGPVLLASDLPSFNAAVVAALRQIAANRLSDRAAALAGEIASRRPHLVGLQEVFAFGCLPLAPGACDEPSVAGVFGDHLRATLEVLAAEGVSYVAAATVENLNISRIPVDLDTPGPDEPFVPDIALSVLDRDVILARGDVATSTLRGDVSAGGLCGLPVFPPPLGTSRPSADGCNYAVVAAVSSPFGPIPVQRGFVAVDATIGGRTYRFVNTHLEVRDPAPLVQALQATELVATLLILSPASLPVLVAGDLNSSPRDLGFVHPGLGMVLSPYQQFVFGGFADAWTLRPGRAPGFTCCELSDLSNPTTLVAERIDHVLTRQTPARVNANVIGNEPSDKTVPSRLWPSDHAAVVSELGFD